MITVSELRKIAKARLRDSDVLYANRRYDGAIYLCGYAVEISLKARICKVLKWADFPFTPNEFKNYQSFKTHDLDILLKLSGRQTKIKTNYMVEWSIIATWDPETRYKSIGSANRSDARDMIQSVKTLLGVL